VTSVSNTRFAVQVRSHHVYHEVHGPNTAFGLFGVRIFVRILSLSVSVVKWDLQYLF
jgi:hypothetical protein